MPAAIKPRFIFPFLSFLSNSPEQRGFISIIIEWPSEPHTKKPSSPTLLYATEDLAEKENK